LPGLSPVIFSLVWNDGMTSSLDGPDAALRRLRVHCPRSWAAAGRPAAAHAAAHAAAARETGLAGVAEACRDSVDGDQHGALEPFVDFGAGQALMAR
jgi:hypothetical protein